jgi:hypothetical protein
MLRAVMKLEQEAGSSSTVETLLVIIALIAVLKLVGNLVEPLVER